ncbi:MULTISPECIES: hypothetical protein [unclassified Bacillus (in: firmicutes)]|uniref:hypothetical protein n=1 Tax=unclassified Bacillus (in: firmicutes) TaxID=185979 RepID=UPI000BF00534|nr:MULTISPECIES: hypothetical protein [unclassified Bacillus (in: firmicutes)]PEJ59234.1 hypothetical protein CN692_07075 [Bacillus sp. AFS002410]PEL07771.1 hypothetical protein CN601_18945 [Bacillus sp. AFS017336]
MFGYIIFYGIPAIFILSGVNLFRKAEKIEKKNKKLYFFFISLAINVFAIPLSLFIGGMATDAPDSTILDFCKGFLVVQGIPLLLLVISIVLYLLNKKEIKTVS